MGRRSPSACWKLAKVMIAVFMGGSLFKHVYGLCLYFHSDTFHVIWLPYPFLIRCLSEVWTLTFRTESCAELGSGISLHSSPGFLDYVPPWNVTEIKKKFIFQPQICIIKQPGVRRSHFSSISLWQVETWGQYEALTENGLWTISFCIFTVFEVSKNPYLILVEISIRCCHTLPFVG